MISLTKTRSQLNQQPQTCNHSNLAELSVTNDSFKDSICLISWRTMLAQERPRFDGAPVLEREMGALHMLRSRADVVEEAG